MFFHGNGRGLAERSAGCIFGRSLDGKPVTTDTSVAPGESRLERGGEPKAQPTRGFEELKWPVEVMQGTHVNPHALINCAHVQTLTNDESPNPKAKQNINVHPLVSPALRGSSSPMWLHFKSNASCLEQLPWHRCITRGHGTMCPSKPEFNQAGRSSNGQHGLAIFVPSRKNRNCFRTPNTALAR